MNQTHLNNSPEQKPPQGSEAMNSMIAVALRSPCPTENMRAAALEELAAAMAEIQRLRAKLAEVEGENKEIRAEVRKALSSAEWGSLLTRFEKSTIERLQHLCTNA